MMAQMRAVLLKQPGGVENLFLGKTAKPLLKPNSLLVHIKATAVNRADTLQRKGFYPPPAGESDIIGLELAGVVEEVGEDVKKGTWKKGDRVMALLGGGGYAEYAVVRAEHVMPIPEKFSFEEAAAIPEDFLTAFQALEWISKLSEGNKSVLIHAAASGVGTAAIQYARVVKANPIIVTAGSADKLEFCKTLGATNLINYKEGSFAPKVLEATNNKGVAVVMDFVGASYWDDNIKSLAVDGTMTLQGGLVGTKVANTDIGPILGKRLTIVGSGLRARSNEYKAQLIADFTKRVLPLLVSGEIKPIIGKVFPWTEVAAAHTYVEENQNIGKVILTVSHE